MIGSTVAKAIFLSLLAESFGLRTTPVINTCKGPVQGQFHKTPWHNVTYASFRGIPYAKPPTKYMRFMAPVEVDSWSEPLAAFNEGSVCPQNDFVSGAYTGNEDCLFLNVHTPEIKFHKDMRIKKRSVMVYIHGGTFKSGYGNASLYGPEYFIEEDIVVVTFNYRLGAAGFLSLGHPNASGNAGLKDQALVLKWVSANIGAFGGDPKNVTLFGQSAGGAAVDLHLISAMSQGYFQSSITMSASILSLWAYHNPDVARKRAYKLAKKVNCDMTNDDTILLCLINLEPEEIVTASANLTLLGLTFLPTVEVSKDVPEEEKFLADCPYTLYRDGKFAKQNHMTGYEKDELLLFAKSLTDLLNLLDKFTDNGSELTDEMPGLSLVIEPIKQAIAAFREGLHDQIFALIDFLTDIFFVRAIDLKQKLMSDNSPHPIYSYKLTFETPDDLHILMYDINVNGSAHGDDFGYIFYNTIVNIPTSLSLSDNQFRRKMTRLWSNHAKYGNPTPPGMDDHSINIVWPEWRKSKEQLVLDNQLQVNSGGTDGITDSQRLAYGSIIDFAQCGESLSRTLRSSF